MSWHQKGDKGEKHVREKLDIKLNRKQLTIFMNISKNLKIAALCVFISANFVMVGILVIIVLENEKGERKNEIHIV